MIGKTTIMTLMPRHMSHFILNYATTLGIFHITSAENQIVDRCWNTTKDSHSMGNQHIKNGSVIESTYNDGRATVSNGS